MFPSTDIRSVVHEDPVCIAITGAAGQIGYQLCFRIAAGDDWVSMAVRSDGSYGIEPVVIYSCPCCENGVLNIVREVEISDFSRERMRATDRELREEREAVADLL